MGFLDRFFSGRRARSWLKSRQDRWRERIERDLVELAVSEAGMTEEDAARWLEDGSLIDRLREALKHLPEFLAVIEQIVKLLALFV